MSERQVNQEIVAVIQPASEDKCGNERIKDGCRCNDETSATQLMQGCLYPLYTGLHRQILIDENFKMTDCCRW